ncbi:MAG: hypothetical protein JHC33_00850 [Ignisphaera sp.]|nr:hypothetical protein [Ignisphaera sp.]
MKKKLLTLALLTISVSSLASPVSTPNNLDDTMIIGNGIGNGNDSYSCVSRTVDLSNTTNDYMLKPCETAIIRFNNIADVPLHIAVPEPPSPARPVIYEITATVYWVSGAVLWGWWHTNDIDAHFSPNNSLQGGSFQILTYSYCTWNCPSNSWRSSNITTGQNYWIDTCYGTGDDTPYLGTFKAIYYGAKYPKHLVGKAYSNLSIALTSIVWDTTTPWTSLGTFGVDGQSASGQIIVKRIQ